MNRLFKYDKAVNSILYILEQLGGRTDMHKLCKILYFADQRHLSEYGRSITGDTYIAMQFGPVPSCIDDILKAVRGDSFFSASHEIDSLRYQLVFDNRYILRATSSPDMEELSVSDAKCLDYSIALCKDKSFNELTNFSHGIAWTNAPKNGIISIEDILREVGEEEAYAEYVANSIKLQTSFL